MTEIFFINPFLIPVIEELDSKKSKIRSLRGFFLSALETMDNEKNVEILTTNLQLSFWRNLKTILRQNKKAVLLEFLFGNSKSYHQIRFEEIEEKIQILQNQVNSLQEKINNLENQILVKEETLNMLSEVQNIRFKSSSN